MFCNQCEQTAKGNGCTNIGVCGKQPEIADLQDLIIRAAEELAFCATEARNSGMAIDRSINVLTIEALFHTLTNVDFDSKSLSNLLDRVIASRDRINEQLRCKPIPIESIDGKPLMKAELTVQGYLKQGEVLRLKETGNKDSDIHSLMQTLLFGLKGLAAYAYHAQILGKEDEAVYVYIHEALKALIENKGTLSSWLSMVLKCGETNLRVMELLDQANTAAYGNPVPTNVPLGVKRGKAILVSGHDLKDLEELLKQSEGKGIYVYTHGEMLPTHAYPGLKKYKHLYGHYGTAWHNQHKEFTNFPGAILMTTNCIQSPLDSYKDNIFTSGTVAWPGVPHINGYDFEPVIKRALVLPGFPGDSNGKSVMVGFAHDSVMAVAETVIDAVKQGKIRHFFLVAGCDGAKPGRNYYSELIEKIPKNCIILTLACGRFRFFDKELGDIGGIPRLLDMGQCNDAYSAIQVAIALSKAFDVSVNDLPLSIILSWYEQKAVVILLTLLHLGIKNIRLGPSLPAFITPGILDVLVKNYDIKPITTPDEDLKAILKDSE